MRQPAEGEAPVLRPVRDGFPVSLSSPRPAGGRPRAAVKSAGAGLAPVADLREARIARYWQEVRAADGGERQQPWIAMILDEMNVGAA